ncbi:MAG: endonuclease [Candidatus Marinimicrobia bacterium]|nr:endonuclease [Candidatus Neomarinimicrobiota bacterium]
MRKIYAYLSITFLLSSMGFSQIPAGYYDTAMGLSGAGLKSALNDIIQGHTSFPYTDSQTDVWDILKQTDKDPNNSSNVILLYTGWSVNAAQEYNNENGWSREHVWAKSRGILYDGFGSQDDVAATDVHHLRPADITVNSARNNRWFDYCSIPYIDEGINTGSFTSTDAEWVWQPRDEVIGDVARMMFYMATRYEGEDGEPDLELINEFPVDRYTNDPVFAKLSTLIAWHNMDPVDEFEQNRNNVIYGFQGNRNPFIDHPEYVQLLWNGETVVNFQRSSLSVYEDEGSINVNVTIEFPDTISATSVEVNILPTSAISGSDYQVTMPQTFSFPAGSYGSHSFPITILDDSELDGPDTLLFELGNISGGNNATIGNPATFQLIILDNEINGGGRTGNLIISEIADGPYSGGLPKIVEITNTGLTEATLTGFTISRYGGGSQIPDEIAFTFPDFVLPAARSVVLTNASATFWSTTITELTIPEYIIYGLDYGFGPIIGNGDDPYELRDDDNAVVDVYGEIGTDGTGLAWEYLDSYAYRNTDISTGTASFNPAEWTIGAVDILDNQQGHLDTYLTPGTHIWERDPVSLVENTPILSRLTLNRNYPNPFNPSTTISYTLQEQSIIILRIFDVLGNEVITLHDGAKTPGQYSVQWNGTNQFGYPTNAGVYFARLESGSSSKTIKMLYLK